MTRVPGAFQRWKEENPWLGLNEENKAYCVICKEGFNDNLVVRLDAHDLNSIETWVRIGFCNWKHAVARMKNHSKSSIHLKYADALKGRNSVSIVQRMSNAEEKQMMDHRTALRKIFSTLRILGRQGLAIRGANNDENSNFMAILRARSEDVSELKAWLNRTGYTWLHHDVQNEILEMMANKIVSSNLDEIRKAEFYSILIDETSDVSRKEQVSIYLRITALNLISTEYFMGFYTTGSTKATALFEIVKDVLIRFQLPFEKLRGQCYVGASNVSGRITGLQQRVREKEPRALYVHCNAHNLNLAVQDGIEDVLEAKNFIGVVKELINFVRDSPKRLAKFQELQADADEINEKDAPALAAYYPTRWVVRIKSLKTVLANYETLITFFQELVEDKEVVSTAVAKASGFLHNIQSFKFLFLLNTMIEIFDRIEILNKDLQKSELCVVESYRKVEVVSIVMNDSRDSKYELVWKKSCEWVFKLGIEEPTLPRKRRIPKRIDDSGSENYVFETPKGYYKKMFYEIFDQVNISLKDRFDTENVKFFKSLETFATGKTIDPDEIVKFYREDFDKSRLTSDRDFLMGILKREETEVTDLNTLVQFLKENEHYMKIVPEFMRFLRLIITIPGSSCSNERSFSVLRRIKNYLRSTMAQNRLNHVAILHSYPDLVDALDLETLMDEFIVRNRKRKSCFALKK